MLKAGGLIGRSESDEKIEIEERIGFCVTVPLRFLINKEGLEHQINVSDGWMVPRQMGRQKVEIN